MHFTRLPYISLIPYRVPILDDIVLVSELIWYWHTWPNIETDIKQNRKLCFNLSYLPKFKKKKDELVYSLSHWQSPLDNSFAPNYSNVLLVFITLSLENFGVTGNWSGSLKLLSHKSNLVLTLSRHSNHFKKDICKEKV